MVSIGFITGFPSKTAHHPLFTYISQASLSVYPEAVTQEPGVSEMSIKQESLEHGAWPGPTGSLHSSSEAVCRAKRVGGNIGGKSRSKIGLLNQVLIIVYAKYDTFPRPMLRCSSPTAAAPTAFPPAESE